MTEGGDTDPTNQFKIAVWAVSAFLALIGLMGGLYATQPWPSKESVTQLRESLAQERADRLEADVASAQERTRNTLAIQALQYEIRALRDEHKWALSELESVKAYVYPQRPVPPRYRPPAAQ